MRTAREKNRKQKLPQYDSALTALFYDLYQMALVTLDGWGHIRAQDTTCQSRYPVNLFSTHSPKDKYKDGIRDRKAGVSEAVAKVDGQSVTKNKRRRRNGRGLCTASKQTAASWRVVHLVALSVRLHARTIDAEHGRFVLIRPTWRRKELVTRADQPYSAVASVHQPYVLLAVKSTCKQSSYRQLSTERSAFHRFSRLLTTTNAPSLTQPRYNQ